MLKVEDVDDLDELLHTNSQKPIKKKKKVDKKIAHTNVSTVSGSAKSNLKTPKGIKIPVNELNVETVKENVLQHDSIDDIHVSMEGIQDLQAALKDMEDKYNQLKNVGILEAEKRFDDFKAASDSQIKGWSLYLIVDYKIMVESLEDRIKILEKSKAAAVSTEDVELEMQAVKEQVRASLMEQMQVAESNWQSEKDSLVAMLQEVKESNENLMSEMERLKADMDVDIQGDTTRIKDGMLNLFQGLSGLSILNAEQNVSDENSFLYTCFIKGSRGGKYRKTEC
jgi:hypothetical protein